MNILSYELNGNMVIVKTDSPILPEVAYHVNKFADIDSLKEEIIKKSNEVDKKDNYHKLRKDNLMTQLDKEKKVKK